MIATKERAVVTGHIYAMWISALRKYKIGFSRNLAARKRKFECQYNCPVEVVHAFWTNDCRMAEQAIHHRFRASAVGHEFFVLSDEDTAEFCAIKIWINPAIRGSKKARRTG